MASAEQIAALKKAFAVFDSDEPGAVTPQIMAGLIQKLGQDPPPEAHLAAFIAKVEAEREKVAAHSVPDVRGVPAGDKPDGESAPLRSFNNPTGPFDYVPPRAHQETSNSMWEVFEASAKAFSENNCIGVFDDEAKAYNWSTYGDAYQRMLNIGSGLRKIGMEPKDFIGIMLPTQAEWTLTEYGAFSQSMCIVTLYESYGLEAIKFIVKDASLKYIVTSGSKVQLVLDMAAELKAAEGHEVACVIHLGDVPADLNNPNNVRLVNWASLETDGANDAVAPTPPSGDDRMFIIYTSGTTGNPKGAVHCHNAMVRCISCAINALPIEACDSHLAFLPLAHIMEQFLEALMFLTAASVGFWGGNIRMLTDYVTILKPTAFIGVPRVLNRYYAKIKAALDGAEGMKKMLIDWAFESKRKSLAKGRYLSFWDPIVFHKAAAALGGRVRFIATGSAPIEPSMLEFFRIVFSSVVVEGYGMTEVLVVSNSPYYDSSTRSHVGPPYEAVSMKLVDVPEMNYLSTDKPYPRGEICIKGSTMMKEYYNNPAKTAETIDSDGWLHTGDIGCFLEDGHLRILDRIKHIFKLSQGEYVAPEKLEQVFIHSKYVAQIFVNGSSLKPCLVAVVVPDPETLPVLAKSLGLEALSMPEIVAHPDVNAAILADLAEVGKSMKLHGYEMIKAVHVFPQEFGAVDLLTPTFKLKRNVAREYFADTTKQLYDSLE